MTFGRPTYTERKQARASALESEHGDFGVEDLPEEIGDFELSTVDEDGEACEKLDEYYVWTAGDRQVEISKRYHDYEVCTRVKEGALLRKDEEIGSHGYLGGAVQMAQDHLE